jgi:hypothetical protein
MHCLDWIEGGELVEVESLRVNWCLDDIIIPAVFHNYLEWGFKYHNIPHRLASMGDIILDSSRS